MLKKHIHLILALQKILALVCLLLFPSASALNHYFDMHERGVSVKIVETYKGVKDANSLVSD